MNDYLPSITGRGGRGARQARAFEELEAEGLVCSFKRRDGQTRTG
jgi:hypothetical protein